MTYPMTPGDDEFDKEVLDRVQQLAEDNPMPDRLRKQIMNWIEPQTVHTETDHADVMDAIGIAYPLIMAWHAAEIGRLRAVEAEYLARVEHVAGLDDDLDEEGLAPC